MYHPRFSPGDRVQLRSRHAATVSVGAIGTVIGAYAIVMPWYEVQLDDHPTPRVFREDELAAAPVLRSASSPTT